MAAVTPKIDSRALAGYIRQRRDPVSPEPAPGATTRSRSGRCGHGLTTGETARKLDVSVDTIRRHLVAAGDLTPELEADGAIPCVRIGGRSYVPRWWVAKRYHELTGKQLT